MNKFAGESRQNLSGEIIIKPTSDISYLTYILEQ